MDSVSVNQNKLAGVSILAFTSLFYYLSSELPIVQTEAVLVDAAFLPKIICAILAICGVIIFFEKNDTVVTFRCSSEILRAGSMLGLLLAYSIAMPLVGFEISTVLYLLLSMFYLGASKRPKTAVILAIATPAVIYILFVKIMFVPIHCLL